MAILELIGELFSLLIQAAIRGKSKWWRILAAPIIIICFLLGFWALWNTQWLLGICMLAFAGFALSQRMLADRIRTSLHRRRSRKSQ